MQRETRAAIRGRSSSTPRYPQASPGRHRGVCGGEVGRLAGAAAVTAAGVGAGGQERDGVGARG